MEQYSWMREVLEGDRSGRNRGDEDDFEERQSELIADTVGGRTKAQLAAEQRQKQAQVDNPRTAESQVRQQRLSPVSSAIQQYQTARSPRSRSPQRRIESSSTAHRPTRTSSHTPPLASSNVAVDKGKSASIISLSGESDIRDFRRNEQHPCLGEGAKQLYHMVQQPFRAKFGTDDRVPSSAREIEYQRAASSKPLISPYLRNIEPEVILQDSPRLDKEVIVEEHPPVFDDESVHQQRPYMDRQTTYPQQKAPSKKRSVEEIPVRADKRSTSTQTSFSQHNIIRDQGHDDHYRQRDRLFGNSGARSSSATDVEHNHHPRPHRFSYQSPLPPTPPRRRHFDNEDWDTTAEDRSRRNIHDFRAHSATMRRPKSLSDYPPLYDFSRRPHIRNGINVDAYAHDPNYYRRRFIESLLSDIRKNKETIQKLDGRKVELDEACKRDADELNICRRERELLVRELELQSRERELEDRERRSLSSSSMTASPLPHPILKHSSSFPPYPTTPATGGGTNNISNGTNRVNFANPISTAKEYTPNNSSIETSIGEAPRPPASQTMQNSNQTMHRQREIQTRMSGIGAQQQEQPRRQSMKENGIQAGYRCQHPLHSRNGRDARIVLSNRTNIQHRPPFLPPSPVPTSRSQSPATEHRRDVIADRENESRRVAHEAEFRAVQQHVKAAAAAQRARGDATIRPILRNSYNPTNPSSLFHFVPLNRNNNGQ